MGIFDFFRGKKSEPQKSEIAPVAKEVVPQTPKPKITEKNGVPVEKQKKEPAKKEPRNNKAIVKIDEPAIPPKEALKKYWEYEVKIKELYAQREKKPKYLTQAIQACYEEIAIAKFAIPYILKPTKEPILKDHDEFMKELLDFKDGKIEKVPSMYIPGKFTITQKGSLGPHTGFLQLCRIRAKEENWEEVLQLATQAKAEGWYGDWDKRVEKARKKLEGKQQSIEY